ncbi:MAG: LysR family transcriptional regulator [Bacteroidota bacterium]
MHNGIHNQQLEVRLRVYVGADPFLGMGRVELLAQIKQLGSISQAAREMDMSYRKAWRLVQEMNELAGEPLVMKRAGGKTGGGAYLSTRGEQALARFRAFEQKLRDFVEQEAAAMEF